MPRDPKDTSVTSPQRIQRQIAEAQDLREPAFLRSGSGPAGAEGPEGKEGPIGPAGSEIPITRGTTEVEFAGGTVKSSIVTVTHGLGKTPTSVQLTAQRSEAGEVLIEPVLIAGSKTTTVFKVRCLAASSPAGGTKISIDWLAC